MTIIPTAVRFARFSLAVSLLAGGLVIGFAPAALSAGIVPIAASAAMPLVQDAGQAAPDAAPDQPVPVQLSLPPAGTEGWG
jgi:hypothetical protein